MYPTRALSLFKELNELKRIKSNTSNDLSFAEAAFAVAVEYCDPPNSDESIEQLVIMFLAGSRLGFLNYNNLSSVGLTADQILNILRETIDSFHVELDALKLNLELKTSKNLVSFHNPKLRSNELVNGLISQPRAGPTTPGKPRLVLYPVESHADHCMMVATYAFLLSPFYGSDPTDSFLIGLFHHLHNLTMPDSGYAGECLLGNHLTKSIESARSLAMSSLSSRTNSKLSCLFKEIEKASSPVAKAFHAADCLDRILQMQYYEKVHNFSVTHAIEELDLIHDGPVKSFQLDTLKSLGLIS